MTSRTRDRAAARSVAVVAAILAATTTLPAVASAGHGATATRSIAGAVPAWAHGRPAAAEPASAPVDVAVTLRTRNAGALAAFDRAVSDPASASYRHFLSPRQYRARFAPSAAAAATVRHWLAGRGLTVDATTPNRTIVTAHGTAATVGHAFGTSFGRFRVGGRLLRAPLSEPSLPSALRPLVSGISGLTETELRSTASPAPAFFNARPCSAYFGQKTANGTPKYAGVRQKYAICGYTPKQIRSAYGIGATHLAGKGATVGIVDTYASPTIVKDTNTYSRRHGLPTLGKHQLTQKTFGPVSNPPQVNVAGLGVVDPQGWAGEETLDVEAVHSVAPKAKIYYVAAASNFGPGLYVALGQAVESGKVQVVSNSWGSGDDQPLPSDQVMFDSITNEAAATGVTINFSSGDNGDETDASAAGFRTGDFPATSPGVTAVGGTSLVVNRDGRRARETYWGVQRIPLSNGKWQLGKAQFYGGGGGGVSTTYAEPSWQKPVVPAGEATYGNVPAGRVEPDLSMVADSTTGFLVGQTQTPKQGKAAYSEYRLGGTSLSCPLFSGLVALAVQRHHGKGLGLITPTLYRHSRTAKGRSALFYDPNGVTVAHGLSTFANVRPDYTDTTDRSSKVVRTLRSMGNLATLHRRTGYDDSTGLGSPYAAAVVRLLG